MNTLIILSNSLIFYVLIVHVYAGDPETETWVQKYKKPPQSIPLALIKTNSSLRLAQPMKEIKYFYVFANPSNGEKFVKACPQRDGVRKGAGRFLRKLVNVEETTEAADPKILIITEGDHNLKCKENLQPTVVPTQQKECFDNGQIKKGDEYKAGYTVQYGDKETDRIHLPLYTVCHSPTEGTLYTVHEIIKYGLGLTLEKFEPQDEFESNLGKNFPPNNNPSDKKIKTYQFVPYHDMPVRTWQLTTRFDFNIIPLDSRKVLDRLQKVDNYIRMSILDMNTGATIYTGRYQATIQQLQNLKNEMNIDLQTEYTEDDVETKYTFMWKLIQHEIKGAIIIITMIDPFDKCIVLCENISTYENWSYFVQPIPGRCTYACKVDGVINKIFGLAKIGTISEILPNRMCKGSSILSNDGSNVNTLNSSLLMAVATAEVYTSSQYVDTDTGGGSSYSDGGCSYSDGGGGCSFDG